LAKLSKRTFKGINGADLTGRMPFHQEKTQTGYHHFLIQQLTPGGKDTYVISLTPVPSRLYRDITAAISNYLNGNI